MRVVAILYIILSVGANFFVGSIQTFVLAAFSFPVLLWLLLRKRKTIVQSEKGDDVQSFNNRDAS